MSDPIDSADLLLTEARRYVVDEEEVVEESCDWGAGRLLFVFLLLLIFSPLLLLPTPPLLLSRSSAAVAAAALNLDKYPHVRSVDPFELVAEDVRSLSTNIKRILGVDHPVLSTVAKYFFDHDGGKKIRPAMVFLMSLTANAHALSATPATATATTSMTATTVSTYPAQRRLAEITEMIHTASLLHDDVIDMADTRRGVSSVNTVFGNKLAVLAGDFLLARASVCLARLRDVAVVELLSTVIEHLVKGEVMQMKAVLQGRARGEEASRAAFELYMRKTYYKTGSLIANSCKAAVLLAHPEDTRLADAAYRYGKHVGIAFQLVDDALDFEGTMASLGKPALNDIKQGIATAPVLFASQDFPSVLTLIERKFEAPGDVESAVDLVQRADGLQRTRALAIAHAQLALTALDDIRPSEYRTALAGLASRIVQRSY